MSLIFALADSDLAFLAFDRRIWTRTADSEGFTPDRPTKVFPLRDGWISHTGNATAGDHAIAHVLDMKADNPKLKVELRRRHEQKNRAILRDLPHLEGTDIGSTFIVIATAPASVGFGTGILAIGAPSGMIRPGDRQVTWPPGIRRASSSRSTLRRSRRTARQANASGAPRRCYRRRQTEPGT